MGAFLCESMNISRSLRSIRIRFPIFTYASRLFAIKHFRNQTVQAIYLAASVILSSRGAAETTTSRLNADRRSSWFRYTMASRASAFIASPPQRLVEPAKSVVNIQRALSSLGYSFCPEIMRAADLRRDISLALNRIVPLGASKFLHRNPNINDIPWLTRTIAGGNTHFG